MLKCDVLVVGAGPAGSSAARAAALNGANVILIEKKRRPGKVACGEAISSYLLPYLPIRIPRRQLLWKTRGIRFYSEGIKIEKIGKGWETFSIDRKKFDFWLAKEAIKKGVKLITNAELIKLKHESFHVKKAFIKRRKKIIEIRPRVLIAADGAESTTLKLLNLYKPKKYDIARIYSWEMHNLKLENPYMEQIYIGDYSDGGYAYIFPKSKNVANVGVGSVKRKNLKVCFEKFLELDLVKKQLKNGKKIIERSGKSLINSFLTKIVYGNILVVGDAAAQNLKPYDEGILPAMICGDICGRIAALHLKKGISLNSYENEINKKFGKFFKESKKITKVIYDLFSLRSKKKYLLLLALVSNLFSSKKIKIMKKDDYKEVKKCLNAMS